MGKKYNSKANIMGRIGEEKAAAKMRKLGWHLKDVRYDERYQTADIDYICFGPFGCKSVEVKTNDERYTYNVFIELTHTNSYTGEIEAGWFKYCAADYLLFVVGDDFHIVPRRAIVDYLKKSPPDLKVTTFSTGYALSINTLKTLNGYSTL